MQLRPHQAKALDVMTQWSNGIIVVPTGGGKTFIAISDAKRELATPGRKTIVVVAPRLLLAQQLSAEFTEHITNTAVMHVHSGQGTHYTTTDPEAIRLFREYTSGHLLIFTTYHSLQRIQESNIPVDVVYFDEAHNSIKKSFFGPTRFISAGARRSYFFTATPKYTATYRKRGMNDPVYGGIIYNVPATELVETGSILPPKINAVPVRSHRLKGEDAAQGDCDTLLDTLRYEECMDKVLIAAPNTKVMMRMFATTNFMTEVRAMGYDLLWITSKHGAFHNDQKVTREHFFNLVRAFGADPDKKFVVLHYSILSEGISVPGLTSLVLMRQMNVIEMCQSVGRVIRLHLDDIKGIKEGTLIPGDTKKYSKPFGLVHVPVYENVGISTVRRLERVVDRVFVQGQPAIATIKR